MSKGFQLGFWQQRSELSQTLVLGIPLSCVNSSVLEIL